MRRHRKHSPGFTLLEVMIALAVFAISAIALLSQSNQGISQSQYLEEKSYALWIAENTLTELRLKPEWPPLGKDNNTVTQFNRDWLVETDVTDTGEQNLRRVEVRVTRPPDAKVVSLLRGYIGRY
ncbi:MAG: type II secretion system minor pseudopilin GspI [Pseudomonadales bacterium]|jgi:general secretion pathway protein I